MLVSPALIVKGNGSITDPVKDYLSKFTFYDGRKNFYSDDRLLRLDIDLNNDGQQEMLLSLARDKNGKQGNTWAVYRKTKIGYEDIGGMTFSSSGFYLGHINDTDDYGIVSFWPGGAGEGMLLAHIFDGSEIKEIQIGEIRRDPITGKLEGKELLDKYSGSHAINGDNVITTISAVQLAKDYGITIEPQTYLQALQEGLPASTPIRTPLASAVATPPLEMPKPSPSAVASTPRPSATATTATEKPASSFSIVSAVILTGIITGVSVFMWWRKSR